MPHYAKARTLGHFLGFLIVLLCLVSVFAASTLVLQFIQAVLQTGAYADDLDGSAIRNIGLVLVAFCGGPFLVWRSIIAAKQVAIADEALFNEKINAAAADLSARRDISRISMQEGKEVTLTETIDDLVVRAAAIDRLEGLAYERIEMSPRIVRLLATYVRGNFPQTSLEPTEPPFQRKIPRMDLQKAIDTIGRVHVHAIEVDPQPWRLDLKNCDLDGVSFLAGFFWAADFSRSRMEACIFRDANFEGCLFVGSLLNFTEFFGANLTGSKFDLAVINQSGGWTGGLSGAQFKGATFIAADITGIKSLGPPQMLAQTFGTRDTKLSPEMEAKRPSAHDLENSHLFKAQEDRDELRDEDLDGLELVGKSGFRSWSPYDSEDLSTNQFRSNLYDLLDLKRWPYW